MNFFFPIFGLFIIFVLWSSYERKKSDRISNKIKDDFWTLESNANNVRKQPLDNENYIIIDNNLLINNLWPNHPEDEQLTNLSEVLSSLLDKRILNLTGKTSTDIKLKYGVANLNEVSSYDDNFTLMVQTISNYGTRLMELGNSPAAISVLEFGIDSLTDISSNYKHLAQLYIDAGTPDKIDHLIETAQNIDSLMKDSIIRTLTNMKDSTT